MPLFTRHCEALLLFILALFLALAQGLQSLLVETRSDAFGGTGLFAIEAVPPGTSLITVPQKDVVYEADPNTIVDQIVDSVSSTKDSVSERGVWSIGAALACWRLLSDQNQATDANLRKLGISSATAKHALALPWKESTWQLPILWSAEVLDASLIYGFNEAVTDDAEETDVKDACLEAKMRVKNLQRLSNSLVQAVGTRLREQGLVSGPSSDNIRLACRQAMALVFSRTCLHSSGKLALLPTIDCANHNAKPNANFQDTEDGVTLQSTEPIGADEELFISYGLERGNCASAFAAYGFVPQGMALESAGGKALHSAATKGQEIAKQRMVITS